MCRPLRWGQGVRRRRFCSTHQGAARPSGGASRGNTVALRLEMFPSVETVFPSRVGVLTSARDQQATVCRGTL